MKRLLLIPFMVLFACSVLAQSREELYNNFKVAMSERDSSAIISLISDWERLFPYDAEIYSLKANYYFQNAVDDVIVMSDTEPTDGRQCLEIIDSLGVKGYMYSEMLVDSTKLDSAKRSLEEGIILHPNRLDLRLGKVTIHLYVNEYADAIKEVKSALEQSKINNNNWLETLDTPIETDGVSYLRDCIQDYFAQFLETDNLPFAEKLADVCVELYPKEAIFLTDKGTVRYYAGDQQGAAEWYLKAHKNSPNDMLIATNIAILYEQQGEIKKAIKYYTIVAKSGDEEFSESAKAEIQKLTCPEKMREIFPVDWKKLKKIVKKDSDAVKEAVNRLSEVESDPSLTDQDRILAFYGQALLTNGREQSLADDASRLFSQKDYVNALGKAKEALEINPLNLTALDKAGAAIVMLIEQGDTSFTSDDAMYYFNVAMRIFNTIAATGYGSEEHPFCITSVADEYVFMRNYLEIYRIKQQALVGVCDVFILEETSQYYSEQKIYFDATLPLERLKDLF